MTDLPLSHRLENFLRGRWRGAKRVQGLQGGAGAYVLALAAISARRPMLIIAAGASEAEKLHEDLAFFLGEENSVAPLQKRLHRLPSWEVLPFENLSPHPDDVAGRLQALYKLIEDPVPVLISTPAALMQKVVAKEDLKKSYLYLVAGQDLARDALLEHLARWGFQNVPLVEERGDFSVRGGIVDVFSPGYARPMRLEFDGDRLESIREFNPSTQRTEHIQEDLLLLPMKEFSLRAGSMDEIVRRLDERALELEMDRRERNRLLESVREGIPFPGMEFLLPYFRANLATVFSYLPPDALIWLDGADRVEAEVERFAQLVYNRHAQAREERRLVAPLDALYLNQHEWREELGRFSQVHGESLVMLAASEPAQENTLTVESYLTTDLRQHAPPGGKEPSLAPLAERLRNWSQEKVIVVAPNQGDATRLREVLDGYQLPFSFADR